MLHYERPEDFETYRDRMLRRPAPAVTVSSYDENRTRKESRRDYRPRSDSYTQRERTDRYDTRERDNQPRSGSRERRRRERRAARYAEDPEGEARRQERRRARRAEREERRKLEDERDGVSYTSTEREQSPVKAPAPLYTPYQQSTYAPQASFAAQSSYVPPTGTPTRSPAVPSTLFSEAQPYAYGNQNWDVELGRKPSRVHQPRKKSSRYYKPPRRTHSWQTEADSFSDEFDEKYGSGDFDDPRDSHYDELHYYKRGSAPERYVYEPSRSWCGMKRKWVIRSLIAATVIAVIIIIAVAVSVSKKGSGHGYSPATAQINNTAAFASGGATHNSVNDTKDGIGAGTDSYQYYSGPASKFPNHTEWISFEDMWRNNLDYMKQSCGWLSYGADDSDEEVQDIYNAIQDRANASLVDHRFVLAIVLQESHGCVRVPHTTSSGGVKNTGLMQAHSGAEYSPKHAQQSILEMVQDGTQGTKNGNGLVQELNMYGDPYKAARAYNSGYIPQSGDLSEKAGATACYVSDVANRLTGWVKAKSSCPDATE